MSTVYRGQYLYRRFYNSLFLGGPPQKYSQTETVGRFVSSPAPWNNTSAQSSIRETVVQFTVEFGERRKICIIRHRFSLHSHRRCWQILKYLWQKWENDHSMLFYPTLAFCVRLTRFRARRHSLWHERGLCAEGTASGTKGDSVLKAQPLARKGTLC